MLSEPRLKPAGRARIRKAAGTADVDVLVHQRLLLASIVAALLLAVDDDESPEADDALGADYRQRNVSFPEKAILGPSAHDGDSPTLFGKGREASLGAASIGVDLIISAGSVRAQQARRTNGQLRSRHPLPQVLPVRKIVVTDAILSVRLLRHVIDDECIQSWDTGGLQWVDRLRLSEMEFRCI